MDEWMDTLIDGYIEPYLQWPKAKPTNFLANSSVKNITSPIVDRQVNCLGSPPHSYAMNEYTINVRYHKHLLCHEYANP